MRTNIEVAMYHTVSPIAVRVLRMYAKFTMGHQQRRSTEKKIRSQ